MRSNTQIQLAQHAWTRYVAGRISRRQLVGALGALGLTAAAPLALRDTDARSAPGGGEHHHMSGMQEGTPAGAPPPAPTPVLGKQPDGTTVWKVIAGGGSEEEGIDLLAYFPTNVTVNVGDAIYWEVRGFHNVHFLSGAPLPEGIIPDPTATPMAGGAPALILNPAVAFPSGGSDYNGTGMLNTGVPLDPSAPPFVITFSAPGMFDYYCTIHGKTMKGTVTVQDSGAAYPMDQAAVDATGNEELTALLATAKSLYEQGDTATPSAAGATEHQVIAGLSAPQMEVNRFFPQQLTIKAGDTVKFVNESVDPPVPHTVTFAGGTEAPGFVLPVPQAGGPPTLTINPQLVAPTMPGGAAYNGQGFANSGILGGAPNAPLEFSLAFDTEGTYRYYCAVHGDPEGGMIGDITVEAAS